MNDDLTIDSSKEDCEFECSDAYLERMDEFDYLADEAQKNDFVTFSSNSFTAYDFNRAIGGDLL